MEILLVIFLAVIGYFFFRLHDANSTMHKEIREIKVTIERLEENQKKLGSRY